MKEKPKCPECNLPIERRLSVQESVKKEGKWSMRYIGRICPHCKHVFKVERTGVEVNML